MYHRPCRLTLIDKFYGGGISAPSISPGQTFNQYQQIEPRQIQNLNSYVAGQPLLNTAQQGLLGAAPGLYNYTQQVINSQGALTPEESRDITQATRSGFAARGNAIGNQALGTELLNRQQYRDQRLQGAVGLQGQETAQLSGLQQSEVGTFAEIVDPLLSFTQNLAIANAQIQEQASAANANKQAGLIGGGLSALSSIGGAAIGASDERLKQKIRDTGFKTPEGVDLKTFEYKTKPGEVMLGVMAQDLEKRVPDAVFTDDISGIKFVDTRRFPIIPLSKGE